MASAAKDSVVPSLRRLAKACGVTRRTIDNWRGHHEWRWHDPPYPVSDILAWRSRTFAIDNAAASRAAGKKKTADTAPPTGKKKAGRVVAAKPLATRQGKAVPPGGKRSTVVPRQGRQAPEKPPATVRPARPIAAVPPEGATAQVKLEADIKHKREQIRKLEFDNAVKEGQYVLRTEYDGDMAVLCTIFVQALNDLQQSLPLQLVALEAAEISQVLIDKFDGCRRQIMDRVENKRGRIRTTSQPKRRAGRPNANRAN